MNRSRRNIGRTDYTVLSTTGDNWYKSAKGCCQTESKADSCAASSCSKMSEVDKLKTAERRHRGDVDEVIELNSLDDFDDLSRIDDHIDSLIQLLKRTREIHRGLEDELGVDDYSQAFDSEETANCIKNEIKKFKGLKSSLKDADRSQSVKAEDLRAQVGIRDDIDLCVCKIDSILGSFPVETLGSVEDKAEYWQGE